MLRLAFALWLLVALAAPNAGAQEPEKPKAKTAQDVHNWLSQGITIESVESNTPLRDVLHFFGDRFGINVFLDEEAFKEELGVTEAAAVPVKLPRMVNVPARQVLQHLCDQIQGGVAQQGAVLWVVPKQRVLPRMLKQEVDVAFDKLPLDEALKQLSDKTGFSIVLDELRAGDAAKTPVTAKLNGVGLESAVRVLADLAGLRVVVADKVMYVTIPDNWLEWERERKNRKACPEKAEEKQPKAAPKQEGKKIK